MPCFLPRRRLWIRSSGRMRLTASRVSWGWGQPQARGMQKLPCAGDLRRSANLWSFFSFSSVVFHANQFGSTCSGCISSVAALGSCRDLVGAAMLARRGGTSWSAAWTGTGTVTDPGRLCGSANQRSSGSRWQSKKLSTMAGKMRSICLVPNKRVI